MKTILSIGMIFISLISLQAQLQDKQPFGKISKEEVEMIHTSLDSLAEAVILFDLGESKFFSNGEGFEIKFTRHKRIKILNEAGRKHSYVHIPYYYKKKGAKEKIKNIKAFSYNKENGVLVKNKLDPTTIYDEKLSEYTRIKKFVFPNVQVGTIVEYSYQLITPFKEYLKDWIFQSKIPTKYSEYKVHMVPFYEYVNLIQGCDSLDINRKELGKKQYNDYGVNYKYMTHTFGLRNIEAFKDESFISSKKDYVKKIDFQLANIYNSDGRAKKVMNSWRTMRNSLLNYSIFGKHLKKSRALAKKIIRSEIDTSLISENKKVDLIINYVKKNIKWNNYNSKYSSQTLKELLKTKSGSSGDINLFLVALLRAAGIQADPMILSTRNHGKIKLVYPFMKATNYVVAYSKDYGMLDATQRKLSSNLIPPNCINEYGLVVNRDKEDGWFTIKHKDPSIEQTIINTRIDPQSLIAISNITSKNTSYKAYKNRKALGNNKKSLKKQLLKRFKEVDSVNISGFYNTSEPYAVKYKANSKIEQLGDYLVLNPLLNFPIHRNPLVLNKRSYPVDFIYPYQNEYQVLIKLPKGYKPTEIPKNVSIENSSLSIRIEYEYNNLDLKINALYAIKKGIYQPKEYYQLKKGIDKIIAVMNKKIYLKEIL